MSPEVQAHLFEPFFTTKELGRGTGLGLAMVHGIVTQAGDHLHVESAPGKGTTFEICLPRLRGKAVSNARAERATATRGGAGETILVVEDDAMVRRVIVRVLQGAGYRVREHSRPADALEHVREDPEPFHLLVTDVQMPGRSGPALATEVRRFVPGVRVLLISGHPGDALVEVAPGDGFLGKPFTADALLDRVRALLDG